MHSIYLFKFDEFNAAGVKPVAFNLWSQLTMRSLGIIDFNNVFLK